MVLLDVVLELASPLVGLHKSEYGGRWAGLGVPFQHTHTHTHTHFQVQGLEKGVSENEAPGPVGAYTTTHNDTITLMPNLIHRISFTELKFECRTRVAEGTSAGRSTLRHNRTHAPTGPRRARTYMRI